MTRTEVMNELLRDISVTMDEEKKLTLSRAYKELCEAEKMEREANLQEQENKKENTIKVFGIVADGAMKGLGILSNNLMLRRVTKFEETGAITTKAPQMLNTFGRDR